MKGLKKCSLQREIALEKKRLEWLELEVAKEWCPKLMEVIENLKESITRKELESTIVGNPDARVHRLFDV